MKNIKDILQSDVLIHQENDFETIYVVGPITENSAPFLLVRYELVHGDYCGVGMKDLTEKSLVQAIYDAKKWLGLL